MFAAGEFSQRKKSFLAENFAQLEKNSHSRKKYLTTGESLPQQEKDSHSSRKILTTVEKFSQQYRRKIIIFNIININNIIIIKLFLK